MEWKPENKTLISLTEMEQIFLEELKIIYKHLKNSEKNIDNNKQLIGNYKGE